MNRNGVQGIILRAALRLVSATWRLREEIPEECRGIVAGKERGIVAFWHGRMFPVWYRFRGRGCSALISASRDGELLAGYLNRSLGYREVIRGSSSKGGSRALAEMIDILSRRTLLITPDGPRGPARQGKPGALVAAVRTGSPVVLAGWSCRRRIRLRSWDSMEIPYPFSLVKFRYCIFEIVPHQSTTPQQLQQAMSHSGNLREEDASSGGYDPSRFWIDDDTLHSFDAALNGVSD